MKDWHKLKPQMFKKQPYYLPGWDSYDTKVQTNIDPQSWRVINGKLYISYDPVSAAEFDTIPDLIERADANWAVRQASKVVE